MHRQGAHGVHGQQPGRERHRRPRRRLAQPAGDDTAVLGAGRPGVAPQPPLQRKPQQHRDPQIRGLRQREVAQPQGRRPVGGRLVGVPDGVVPAGRRGRQRRLHDLGLRPQLGQIAVEHRPGLPHQPGVPGVYRLARGLGRRAGAGARILKGPLQLAFPAGGGEVDGGTVGSDGAGQILEHGPDLVVEAFLRRPARGVPGDGFLPRGLAPGRSRLRVPGGPGPRRGRTFTGKRGRGADGGGRRRRALPARWSRRRALRRKSGPGRRPGSRPRPRRAAAADERFRPTATAAMAALVTRRPSGSPWSASSAASPAAYPWPTARIFHAPCLRYNSSATTADSSPRPSTVQETAPCRPAR